MCKCFRHTYSPHTTYIPYQETDPNCASLRVHTALPHKVTFHLLIFAPTMIVPLFMQTTQSGYDINFLFMTLAQFRPKKSKCNYRGLCVSIFKSEFQMLSLPPHLKC